ncbi:MAG: hypothetical protein KF841_07045 [Phycisphaerae bacterium]|nr:hypothetical protein [Phycisphaerae bacterium]
MSHMFLLACLFAFQSTARGESGGADIARALDQTLPQITISDQELPDALDALGRQAAITMTLDENSADLLPWGRRTRLKTLTVQNKSLREVLPQILGVLGMVYEIRENDLLVVAGEPLKRINRRATWDDLKLLRELNETEFSVENMEKFRIQYRITAKLDAPGLLNAQLLKAGRGSIAQNLETATGALGWVWFPNGDHIAIRTSEAQIANRLSRRITVRYANEPLTKIIVDLGDRAETFISFDPGLLLRLPPRVAQGTTLNLERTSIRQALELLVAETGIKYEIRRTGIHISASDTAAGAALGDSASAGEPARRAASSYVGKISIPSGDGTYSYEFLLRADELPDDILEYRRQLLEAYIQKIRADMAPVEGDNSPGGAGE